MPLESMWIGNLIPGLSMQEPHRDVPPDKVPPPKHPPDVIPFDPDEEPDFPPGGPPIKDPQPDPEPSMYTRSSLMSAYMRRLLSRWFCQRRMTVSFVGCRQPSFVGLIVSLVRQTDRRIF